MSTGQLVGLVVAAVVVVGLLVAVLLVVRRRQRRPADRATDRATPAGQVASSSPAGAAGRRRSDAVEGVDPGTAGTHRGTDPAPDRGAPPVDPPSRSTRPSHRA